MPSKVRSNGTQKESCKKRYTSPSFKALDAAAAEGELKAKGRADDPNLQRMLSLIEADRRTQGIAIGRFAGDVLVPDVR